MDIRSVSNATPPATPGVERDAGARAAATATAPAIAAPAAPATAAAAGARQPGADGLDEAVSKINKSLKISGQGVEFSIDEDSKRVVVKVVDQETREVLRQMPSAEALAIAKALDQAQGMLIKQEA